MKTLLPSLQLDFLLQEEHELNKVMDCPEAQGLITLTIHMKIEGGKGKELLILLFIFAII